MSDRAYDNMANSLFIDKLFALLTASGNGDIGQEGHSVRKSGQEDTE